MASHDMTPDDPRDEGSQDQQGLSDQNGGDQNGGDQNRGDQNLHDQDPGAQDLSEQGVLDAIGDLVVQRDAEGRIVFVNAAFRRALGGDLADWVGRWFLLAPMNTVDAPGGRLRFDAGLNTVIGPASFEWEETPLPGGGAVLVARDVSQQRASAFALEGARADAEARAAAKEELFAAVTHELRTPLNGVLGLAKLLDKTPLNPEQRDYIAAIEESGRHLLGLVEDMLDAAKLAAGDVGLAADEVDPVALVESVAGLVAPRAREKGLELATCVDPAAPARVVVDAVRLRQVLINLVGNAVKFTETGGVAIALEVENAGAETAALRFGVRDTGPGIAEADRGQIFEAFCQGDASAARKAEGAGLGLSIARSIVEAMGGAIGLNSAPGKGAEFYVRVTLPVAAPVDADAAVALDGQRVMFVGAEPITRSTLAAQCAALGAEASVCDIDALGAALRADPDRVVVVDEALAERAAPIVGSARAALVLIAPDQHDVLAARLKAGYAGWLVKPCRLESAADRIARAWRGERSTGADAAVPVEPESAQACYLGARVLLVEDNPVNRLLALSLLKRMGLSVEPAESGEHALEALAARRFDLVLMDMRLPGLDGLEVTRRLREREGDGRRTPVVALTANATAADRRACLDAGMDDFLVKPIDEAGLNEMMARWTTAEAQSKLRA